MILYRLAWQRFVQYFHLDDLFKEDERLLMLLHKKPKVEHKTQLLTDRTLNLYISILLSIISILICLSIPFAALEKPCAILKEKEFHIIYNIAVYVSKYLWLLDIVIVSLILVLVYATTKMVLDAIKRTKINISPWIEQGKYKLPGRMSTHLSTHTENSYNRQNVPVCPRSYTSAGEYRKWTTRATESWAMPS